MADELFSKKDADLASRVLKPSHFDPELLGYLSDFHVVNQPDIPASSVSGSQFFSKQLSVGGYLTVNNTAVNTSIFSGTIPGGALGTKGCMRLLILAYYLNNSGSDKNFTISVYLGAGPTTMVADTVTGLSSTANWAAVILDCYLQNADATNSQSVHVSLLMSSRVTAPATGFGDLNGLATVGVIAGTAAVDSTVNQNFSVALAHSAAHANTKFERYHASLRKISH